MNDLRVVKLAKGLAKNIMEQGQLLLKGDRKSATAPAPYKDFEEDMAERFAKSPKGYVQVYVLSLMAEAQGRYDKAEMLFHQLMGICFAVAGHAEDAEPYFAKAAQ